MTHAYSEFYVANSQECLAAFFDYTINGCGLDSKWVAELFVTTGYAEQFERGNPAYIASMSGIELGDAVITKAYGKKIPPKPDYVVLPRIEHWAGWFLTPYQWFTGRRFRDIFMRVPFTEILDMYFPYHEMDITHFIDAMEKRYAEAEAETNLERIRNNAGLSQEELARRSGIPAHTIATYEQRASDIDKTEAHIVYKLSRVLGCEVDDLLENPMRDGENTDSDGLIRLTKTSKVWS